MKLGSREQMSTVQELSSVSENDVNMKSASELLISSKGNVLITTTFLKDLIADEKNGRNCLMNLIAILLEFSDRSFGDGVLVSSSQGAREFLSRKSDLGRARELVAKMSSQAFDNIRIITIIESI